jgi:hypothetical protein
MKITIEADEMKQEEGIIEAYIRHSLKMLNIKKVKVEKEKGK